MVYNHCLYKFIIRKKTVRFDLESKSKFWQRDKISRRKWPETLPYHFSGFSMFFQFWPRFEVTSSDLGGFLVSIYRNVKIFHWKPYFRSSSTRCFLKFSIPLKFDLICQCHWLNGHPAPSWCKPDRRVATTHTDIWIPAGSWSSCTFNRIKYDTWSTWSIDRIQYWLVSVKRAVACKWYVSPSGDYYLGQNLLSPFNTFCTIHARSLLWGCA